MAYLFFDLETGATTIEQILENYKIWVKDQVESSNPNFLTNLDEFEEVGLYGFTKARENDPNIDAGAKDIEENGVFVDERYGKELFNKAIDSVLLDIKKLLK